MKHTIIYMILSLMLFTSVASAYVADPITEFTNITPTEVITIPDQMHTFEYTVTSTHAIDIAINFTISHTEIEHDEWNITVVLNGNEIEANENETHPGRFISNETILPTGKSNLNVSVKSAPFIIPGSYAFEIRLLHNDIVIATPKKKSGGGRRYPTPTPTPMPVNATETPTPVPTDELNETEMYINITEPSQDPDGWKPIPLGISVTLSAIMVAFLYGKRKGE